MSQADCKTREIDGMKYSVYMLPPKTARKMLTRIFQVAGPSIGSIIGQQDDDVSKVAGPVLAEFAGRLDDADLDWMMNDLAKITTAEVSPGKEPFIGTIFDIHFRGRIAHMFKWFVFALEVQFADFWEGSDGGLNGLLSAVRGAMASQSQSISTGTSGDQSSQKGAA